MLRKKSIALLLAGLIPALVASGQTDMPKLLGAPAEGALPPLIRSYRSFVPQLEMGRIFHDELGVKQRCFSAGNVINGLGQIYGGYPPIWVREGIYEFEHLDEQMQEMLTTNPDGGLICQIDLNTPWWLTRKLRFDSFTNITLACASERWRTMELTYMKEFIKYAEEHYGDKIDGYMICAGSTYEWLDWLHGITSEDKNKAWVAWQKKHGVDYGPDAPGMTALRNAAFENHLYDPATEQDKVDYWKFGAEMEADVLLEFAHEARAMLPKGKQIGAFFGYIWMGPRAGHGDYERVFASPDLDFFASPAAYGNREIGKGTGSALIYQTAMLNGKRLVHEIDCRPHDFAERAKRRNLYVRDRHQWFSPEEDLAGSLREACFSLVNHAGYWWFDQWGSYYDDPKLRERIAQMEVLQERFKDDLSPSVAEVLLVVDPQSMYYIREGDPFLGPLVERLRNQLNKFGAPFECCTFSDLGKFDLSQFKVIILPHLFLIDEARTKLLREQICTPGRTVVFSYAPGILDGKTFDTARIQTWAGVPFGTGKGLEDASGIHTTRMPGGWTSVYAYSPVCFTEETMQKICKEAGVHFYVDDLWPVFANERLLSIHCKEGGERTVMLPGKVSQVVDLLSGEVVAKRAKSFKVKFASPDTRLYEIIP